MKKIIGSITCATLLIFSSCCHKEIPTKLTGYFYTTDSSSNENVMKLYIDGQEKGLCPLSIGPLLVYET